MKWHENKMVDSDSDIEVIQEYEAFRFYPSESCDSTAEEPVDLTGEDDVEFDASYIDLSRDEIPSAIDMDTETEVLEWEDLFGPSPWNVKAGGREYGADDTTESRHESSVSDWQPNAEVDEADMRMAETDDNGETDFLTFCNHVH